MLGWSKKAIRRGGLAALVLLAIGGPSALLANFAPDQAAAPRELDDAVRLEAIRVQLERRNAQRRHLERQIAALEARISDVQAQRDDLLRTLDGDRAEVARLEQELDRLVPRLLIDRRREAERERASARTLASIASLSRASISPEMRARLRAISPVMLRRLANQGSGLAALEARAQRLIERHRQLQEGLPTGMAERARLEMQREQSLRQRTAAERRLEEMAVDLERLAREEAVIGRRILRAEQAQAADLSRRAANTARAPFAPQALTASAAEAALGKPRLDPGLPIAVRPAQAFGSARVVAAALSAADLEVTRPAAAPVVWPPPPAKPSELVERAQIADRPEQTTRSGRSSFSASVGQSIRVRRPSRPIVPSPDALLDPVLQAVDQRPVIIMPARSGQEVAAPDAGRVAFSGGFGSYGLLLILEHERDYHTILWGFSKLNVSTGEQVAAGEIIGVMGDDGSPELRVEFRRNGQPVGILPWLAASSSKVRG